MSQELKYTRKGKTIHDIQNNSSETFESIGLAKRKSRELQIANGGLGLGSLQVKK